MYESLSFGGGVNDNLPFTIEQDLEFLSKLPEKYTKNFKWKKSFEINGAKYLCEYDYSVYKEKLAYTVDYYSNDEITVAICEDTKEIVFWDVFSPDYINSEILLEDVTDPMDTAIGLSEDIAKEYVDDLSAYERTVEEPRTSEYYVEDGRAVSITYYEITYMKKVDGVDTVDFIKVKATSKGHIYQLNVGTVGIFDDGKLDFDIEKVNESVDERMKSLYANIENYKLLEYSFVTREIVILPNGQIALLSMMDVIVEDEQTGLECGTLAAIATVIE